jgi:hypothetical protein
MWHTKFAVNADKGTEILFQVLSRYTNQDKIKHIIWALIVLSTIELSKQPKHSLGEKELKMCL